MFRPSLTPPDPLKAPRLLLDKCPLNVYIVDIMVELLGIFEQAVLLSVLKLAGDAYGRAILRAVQTALAREVAAGAVYVTLDRLERKGLLASRLEDGTPIRAGRARRYYTLTGLGIDALNESKAAHRQMWRGAKLPLGAHS